jgi:hypothetical protein
MNNYSRCRYFKGEKENPFDKEKQNEEHMLWFYESKWHAMNESDDDMLDLHLSEYTSMPGLVSFEHLDGTPITLKALLFNRFCKGYYARIFALDDFKKWYIEVYKGKH